MADSNHVRRDDYLEFSENDPFAELTRIMGHDPREQQPAAPQEQEQEQAAAPVAPAAEDFALDLERELAADLDFSDFSEPVPQEDWRAEALAEEPAAAAITAPADGDFGLDLERELAAGLDFSDFSEPAPQEDWRTEVPAEEPAAAAITAPAHGDFGLDLERELAADLDFSDLGEPASQEDWRAEAPAEEPYAVAIAPAGDEASFDPENELVADLNLADYHEPDSQPDWQAPAAAASDDMSDHLALDAELEAFFVGETGGDDAPKPEIPVSAQGQTGEAFHDAPEQEPAFGEATPAYESADNRDVEASSLADEAVAQDEWAAEAEFDIDFLERELAASAATAQPHPLAPPPASFEAEPFPEPEELSEPVVPVSEEPADRPLSLEEELNLLLAADPLPAAPEIAPQQTVSQHATPQQAATATGFGRANFAAPRPTAEPAPVAASAPIFAAAAPVFASAATPAAPAHEPAPAEPVETVADDGLDHLFGDDFTFQLDEDIEAQETRVTPAASQLPEIETIEVAEAVPPVNDDLDIPEIAYDMPASAKPEFHDDFQSDFAHIFGDTGIAEATPAVAAAGMAAATTAPEQKPQDGGYVLDDTQWQAEPGVADSGFNYETDLEQAIAMSAYEDEPAEPVRRRRGVLAAAVLGGIVILGGAGVFGMSMFGGGSDTPAIVRADPEPMKVRPENPGGTTVPNQDNEVYQRVSGASSSEGPQQEQLIASAEEPVDVAARTAPQEIPAALAPGMDDEAEFAAPVKSEDRIEQTPEAASPVEAQETAMVTPRRVRTMVVRPDGTMVPREEPAAVQEPVQTGIPQPAMAGEAAALAPAGQPVQPADEIDGGPTIEMPETVAVVPTQRSAAQQQAASPAAPQPAVQQPATPAPVATPVAAPAAAASSAASEWSMQIASQPTAEGAQSSYQDLARRYGNVLEGRGVNIVRADIDGRGTYYRVRIPASSRDEAIQLCTRYKAAGGSCFVSR